MHLTRNPIAALLAGGLLLIVLLAAGGSPASAAKKKSCTRGGATLEAAAGGVRVVRRSVKHQSSHETRRQNLLACWVKTGKRTVVAREVDFGLDNIARTRVEIVQGRYVGVIAENEGGVSLDINARIYDARTGKLLHDSKACDEVDQVDFAGVDDVAFLDGGGMAMSCRRLLLFRKASSAMETLEPAGTDVRQIGVSHNTRGFGQRLFWTVATGPTEVTKSLTL